MILAVAQEAFHEARFHDPDDIISERNSRDPIERHLPKKAAVPAQKPTQTPLKQDPHITTQEKSEAPAIKLDFEKFNREDALRKIQRDAEDKQRQEQWKIQDQEQKESRNKEGLGENSFNVISGVHSTAQEEKEIVRSKNIFETNKARMFEDFKKQSERFDAFANTHTEFKSNDGEKLLKLGKIDDFISMPQVERNRLLDDITIITEDENRLGKFSIEAMQDLVQLTRLSIGKQNLDPQQLGNFNRIVQSEISAQNAPLVKEALMIFLKDSIKLSLESMRKYSDAIEDSSIQDSIQDLASIRRVKNFSSHATMVLGTAGLVVMCIPGASHIAQAIHLTAERLFIGAKALFLGAHASAGVEVKFQKTLQDKYVDAFQHLLPESTKLLKTEIIKTIEEKGFFKKAKDWFKKTAQAHEFALENSRIGDQYKKTKEAIKSGIEKFNNHETTKKVKDGIKSVTDAIKKGAKKLFRKIGSEEAQKEIAQEFSLGVKFTPEEIEKLTKNEIAKAEIESKISSLETKIKAHKTSKGITDDQTFDIELYKMQDELNSHLRTQKDLLRSIDWQKEDAAATALRDKENNSQRTLKGASTDSAIDKEKENVRNKEIIDINRKRLQEDFAIKAERFKTFFENNKEFAVKNPWNNILQLGDMNAFTTMTPEARENLLNDIERSMKDFFKDPSQKFDEKDIQAAQQLISLTNLYKPAGQKSPDNITQALQSEIALANPDAMKQALQKFFEQSTTATLATLREFSKNLDISMDSLEKIRKAKAISFGSVMIATVAGVAVMVTGHPLVFHKVKITLEQCAILGKVGLAGSHASSHEEKDILREIQDQYTKAFQSILPESTQLLESVMYKNEAKTIGQRIKETTIGGLVHKGVIKPIANGVKAAVNVITDSAKSAYKGSGLKDTVDKNIKTLNFVHKHIKQHITDPIKEHITDPISKGINKISEKTGWKDYKEKQKQKLQDEFNLAQKAKTEGTKSKPAAPEPPTPITTETKPTAVTPAPVTTEPNPPAVTSTPATT
jgi:hypothetical protein